MKIRLVFFAIAILILATPPSYAPIMAYLTYEELWEKSDLVVIAKPMTKTADTSERTYFQDMVTKEASGKESKVHAIGVETVFEVLVVLKGNKDIEEFVLHHYREPEVVQSDDSPVSISFGGPHTVFFDPDSVKPDTLLFLVREEDGRFAPYGGQNDPAARTIFSLADPNFFLERG